jgi:Tol biopolymer transport system component/predicted Ser/Thr protein kinase
MLAVGTDLLHYRIQARLGTGGMGEVYQAYDTKLGRVVALKIIRRDVADDPDRMRRFQQEARAVAALNHPNVAQIYDIDESDGMRFIVMEYVEGTTLAARIFESPLDPDTIVELSIQLADALGEAHSKGITHRDIKPGNIILTPRGNAKVLDFGLAKFADARLQVTSTITSPGVVVGTTEYMSPEQALGHVVDHRSDIFSLGTVLYEMATGKRAFSGKTQAAIYDAILNRPPVSPRELNPEIPEDLERVILKAVEKDRELRYQSASDLKADLKRVRRDSASERQKPAVQTTRAKFAVASLIIAILVAGATAVGVYFFMASSKTVSANLRLEPLTTFPGIESQASFSPEGNQVAFSWNGEHEDDWEIYVKVVGAGTPLRLTTNPATDSSPAWSPDGRYIVFLRQSEDSAGFYMVPALGGLERKLSDAHAHRIGVDSPFVAWSPDGKTLALVDREAAEGPLNLYLLSPETAGRQRLTFPPDKWLGDSSPAFSPDGRSIAFLRTISAAVQDVYVVSVSGGEPRRLTNENRRIYGLAWDTSRNQLIFSSNRSTSARLWRLSPSGGSLEPISEIGDGASFIAISRQGNRLAYTRSVTDTNIWRYPLGNSKAHDVPSRLISSTRHELGPQYSPDGNRIVFNSSRTGPLEVWICDQEGANAYQLTNFNGPATGSPRWSPDGKHIAFDSRPGGNADVYTIASEGGNPARLTTEPSDDIVPNWSGDGQWIYFASNRTGTFQVWKMPRGGGDAVQVTNEGGFHAAESPDGKYLYFTKGLNLPGLWRIPVAGGKESQVLKTLRAGYWAYWAVVDDGIYYLEREESSPGGTPKYELRFLNLTTGKQSIVTPLEKRPYSSGLALSPDRRWFLYTQIDTSDTDIMLVENFR